jgi:ABC-type dipeptide/oligopeptide/nickel transport system permease component
MAIVLLFTLFYAGINLLVDLLYGLIDPRIRLGGERA